MGLHVNLSKAAEASLRKRANALGVKVEDYAASLLESSIAPKSKSWNGRQIVAAWTAAGVIGSRADILDGAAHARKIRSEAEKRSA